MVESNLSKITKKYKKALNPSFDWCWAWTHPSAIEATSVFFQGCSNVLDIGSGVGKFCILSAAGNPLTKFVGVEIYDKYFNEAVRIKKHLEIENVDFINADFRTLNLNDYDGFYIYNPFPMTIPYPEYKKCVSAFRDGLSALKPGTKLVMLNQFCETPDG